MGIFNKAKAVANVATGGTLGAAQNLSRGDAEGAAISLGTGGLSSVDDAFLGGKVGQTLGAINPFKKPNLPSVRDPRKPADVQFNRPDLQNVQVSRTPGPAAGQIDFTPQQVQMNVPGQFRDAQAGLLSQLQAQARGDAPSLAQMQLQQAQEANIAAQQAALASARGGPGGQAGLARQAMQQGAAIQGQTAAQGAQLRLQEQLAAQAALGQLAGQAREQDIGVAGQQAALQQQYQQLAGQLAGQQAGFDTQAGIAGAQIGSAENLAQAQLQQQMNQMGIQMAQLEMAAAQGNQQAALQLEQMRQAANAAAIQGAAQADANQKQLIGGILGAGAEVGAKFIPTK